MWAFDQLQADYQKRIIHPNNLRAMCVRISGMCHTYTVTQISKRFAYVEYNNPSEYGTPNPMTAMLPVLPDGMVVLDIHGVRNDYKDGEGWQNFQMLLDCPVLWRSAPDKNDWRTREEVEADQAKKGAP